MNMNDGNRLDQAGPRPSSGPQPAPLPPSHPAEAHVSPAHPFPASVQAVLSTLHNHKPMTGKQLREATGLPRRTIYTALRRLREMGLLEEQASLRDTRQTYFWVHEPQAHPN